MGLFLGINSLATLVILLGLASLASGSLFALRAN